MWSLKQYSLWLSFASLTLSSIYTRFNTPKKKKKTFGKHCRKKVKLLKWAISPSSAMFSMRSVYQNPLIATFHLPSVAFLNSGRSQNCVLISLEAKLQSYMYDWKKNVGREDKRAGVQVGGPSSRQADKQIKKKSRHIARAWRHVYISRKLNQHICFCISRQEFASFRPKSNPSILSLNNPKYRL